jgi:hypothetical protein
MIKELETIEVSDFNFDLLHKPLLNYDEEILRIGTNIAQKLTVYLGSLKYGGDLILFGNYGDEDNFIPRLGSGFNLDALILESGHFLRNTFVLNLYCKPFESIDYTCDDTLMQILFRRDSHNQFHFCRIGAHDGRRILHLDRDKDSLRLMIFADRLTDPDMFLNMCRLNEHQK